MITISANLYKPCHSTETALLRVKNDIQNHMSKRKGVFLVLLDLSSAFDTISHPILLSRLHQLGIRGAVLKWMESYLSGRSSRVLIDGAQSEPRAMQYGLPQGSIVGPSAFNIYTIPIGRIIRKFQLSFHTYADDIQLYTSFDPHDQSSITSALNQLSSCITAIKSWMTLNMLKLNDEKTEFTVITSPHLSRLLPPISLSLGGQMIHPSAKVRNLGVIFDSHMSMSQHIQSLCTSLNFQLRNISQLRRFMDFDTSNHVIRALILSRLDYGNGLLLGVNKTDIQRLQRVQNWAARLVHRAAKHEHTSPLLHSLHWLPVHKRITFKVLCLVYKCLHRTVPCYLSSCVSAYIPPRPNLRSANDTTRLSVPNTTHILKTVERKSFELTSPSMWNSLPPVIRESPTLQSFKKHLKSFLYS